MSGPLRFEGRDYDPQKSPPDICDKCALMECQSNSMYCLEAVVLGKTTASMLPRQRNMRRKYMDGIVEIEVTKDNKWKLIEVVNNG